MSLVSLLSACIATNSSEKTLSMKLTYYGWLDQCPPGSYVPHPRQGSKTKQAHGSGAYHSPITFAGTTSKTKSWYIAPHTKIYIKELKKYFIMEDDCEECAGHEHIDLWTGPSNYSSPSLIDCENALTNGNLYTVIVDPADSYEADTTPFFDGEKCMKSSSKCSPESPPTKGCNTCQLNWDAIGEQPAYPKEGYSCKKLANLFMSGGTGSVERLKKLNPSWDCGSDGSKLQSYSNKNFCQGDSCAYP
jgi:hypothetical protein